MPLISVPALHVPQPHSPSHLKFHFLSRNPVRQGETYVGVEETQDELEVRLLTGDERHLCGGGGAVVVCRRVAGAVRLASEVAKLERRRARILQRLGVCAGASRWTATPELPSPIRKSNVARVACS